MSAEPPKFVKDPSSGTRRLNPEWKIWKEQNSSSPPPPPAASTFQQLETKPSTDPAVGTAATTVASVEPTSEAAPAPAAATGGGGALGAANIFSNAPPPPPGNVSVAKPMPNSAQALPVISSIGEQQKYLGADTKISQNYIDARNRYVNDQTAQSIGVPTADLLNNLDYCFARYEIPLGLLDKVMIISQFSCMELIIDDSGSMNATSDQKDKNGRRLTRWEEVKDRLKIMFELLAYIPFKCAEIHFLNRRDVMTIQHLPAEPPQAFITRVYSELDRQWSRNPSGGTPALERIRESLNRRPGQFVARYFFGDGVPNGGRHAQDQITQLLVRRPNPAQNPFTFMSCSERDADVEWMKEAEEVAPYAGEYDDYYSEAQEVLGDQGEYFPFSMGFYICGMLVGAMYPDTIDNLDEAVPFTKATMVELLGYELSDEEYNAYFQGFLNAQLKKRPESNMDRTKVHYARSVWPQHREEFRSARVASEISVFQQYKRELTSGGRSGGMFGGGGSSYNNGGSRSRGGGGQQDDCCCIVQ